MGTDRRRVISAVRRRQPWGVTGDWWDLLF